MGDESRSLFQRFCCTLLPQIYEKVSQYAKYIFEPVDVNWSVTYEDGEMKVQVGGRVQVGGGDGGGGRKGMVGGGCKWGEGMVGGVEVGGRGWWEGRRVRVEGGSRLEERDDGRTGQSTEAGKAFGPELRLLYAYVTVPYIGGFPLLLLQVYRRELEEDGVVVDPLKSYYMANVSPLCLLS